MIFDNQILSQIFKTPIFLILLTITINSQTYCNDSLYLSKEEFKYANAYRHTITGETAKRETKLSPLRTSIVAGTIGALFTVQHIAQSNTIWAEESPEFKIQEDGAYGLYVDKIGHFSSAYTASYVFGEAMYFIGMDKNAATLWGGAIGFAYLNYIEVMDGYGANFGFSPSDVLLNSTGVGFYVLQNFVPWFQNITPKWSYYPADLHGEFKREPHFFFVDDYSSQTFWLSINIHNILPNDFKRFWPKWLEISLGYTARNMTIYPETADRYRATGVQGDFYNWGHQPPAFGSPRYILALDWNLMHLVPENFPGWTKWIAQTLNNWKLPSPALEFSNDGPPRFLITYPFPLW